MKRHMNTHINKKKERLRRFQLCNSRYSHIPQARCRGPEPRNSDRLLCTKLDTHDVWCSNIRMPLMVLPRVRLSHTPPTEIVDEDEHEDEDEDTTSCCDSSDATGTASTS